MLIPSCFPHPRRWIDDDDEDDNDEDDDDEDGDDDSGDEHDSFILVNNAMQPISYGHLASLSSLADAPAWRSKTGTGSLW